MLPPPESGTSSLENRLDPVVEVVAAVSAANRKTACTRELGSKRGDQFGASLDSAPSVRIILHNPDILSIETRPRN